MNKIDTTIARILQDHDFRNETFFIDLKDQMTKEKFIKTQKEFYHAVTHFTSPLAMVAAAIPTYQQRVSIIKNLWEEHGEGDLSLTHGETFIEFLRRLSDSPNPNLTAPGKGVQAFNLALDTCCKQDHYLKSTAVLGIIEMMFADISGYIASAIIERGWLAQDQLTHYSVHQELDCIHAEDFFSILRCEYNDHHRCIDEGLTYGAITFLELFKQISENVSPSEI